MEVVNFIFGKQPFNKFGKVVFVSCLLAAALSYIHLLRQGLDTFKSEFTRMQGFTQISLEYWDDELHSLYNAE